MTVGERIKERRKALDISADELALKLGVSRSTVFRYENGSIEKIPANILDPISKALSTTPEYLMGLTDDPYDYVTDKENRISAIPSNTFHHLYKLHEGNLSNVWKAYWDSESDRFSASINEYTSQPDDVSTSVIERKVTNDDLKLALFGGDSEVTDEMWEEALLAAEIIRERHKRKKDKGD